jgi:hypothetical protein
VPIHGIHENFPLPEDRPWQQETARSSPYAVFIGNYGDLSGDTSCPSIFLARDAQMV